MANYDQIIYETAINEGFSPTASKLIVAQARLESGNYNSNVFQKNNNMFGMKYVDQPLATKGTLAPYNERSESCKTSNVCQSRDHYAKYQSPADSVKDVISRLYRKERNGIGFEQLKDVKDADEFARKLKQRNYYGFYQINTPEGENEITKYANGLKARLLLVNVLEYYRKNRTVINYSMLGIGIILLTVTFYFISKKKNAIV